MTVSTETRRTKINENRQDSLNDVYQRIMSLEREDYAIPANQLAMCETGTDTDDDVGFRLAERDQPLTGELLSYPATDYAVGQLSDRLSKGLRSFGNEMVERGHRDLYADTVNELLERAPADQKFQIRTIQPNGQRLARAVVSDAFKPIDDSLIVPPMIDAISEQSTHWRSLGGQITDTHSRLRFIGREPVVRGFGPNKRDLFPGFQFTNSEVGCSKTRFELFFFDSFCENGCVFGQQTLANVNFTHRGTRIQTVHGLISEERIQQAELLSVQALIIDATVSVLKQDHAEHMAQTLLLADSRKLDGERPELIRQISQRVGLTKKESDNVLGHWYSNEDTAFGVSNAITRLGQDASDYESRVRIEQAGGKVLEMSDREWRSVMALAS